MGTPSNGTGAGFWSTGGIDSQWKDSAGLLRLKIPNYLFGVPTRLHENHLLDFATHEDEILLENLPTQPDVEYPESFLDIGNENGGGWLSVALEQLLGTGLKP